MFPRYWPKDDLCVEAAELITTLQQALHDIIDADTQGEAGGIEWTGVCGEIARKALGQS